MKRYLNLRLFFGLFLVLSLILAHPFAVFADVNHLMINTNSNALMTLELDDSDYMLMSPRSSVGTVGNTVKESQVIIYCTDGTHYYNRILEPQLVNGRFDFNFTMPDGFEGYWIRQVDFFMKDDSTGVNGLPPNGIYDFSFDFSSDFSFAHPYANPLYSVYEPKNTALETSYYNLDGHLYFNSGDMYIAPFAINIRNNVEELRIITMYYQTDQITNFAGSYAMRFNESSASSGVNLAGSNSSANDYENDVSSSLSDLSSSVDSMTEDLSSAAENLEYISTSQNLIIQGIDNVVMHISDQLFAFWNQLFNLIHLPTMAKMDDIISAINNMDLEIEVNLDGLKSTINNMSAAVQNKLQSTTDQITGGYDSSGMASDKSELDGVLNLYEQAEEDLFDDAKGNINDFEFDTPLEQFTGPLSDVSYFLSGLFEAMGPMNVIITFSLTLTIAMVMIGWYRFKGGR